MIYIILIISILSLFWYKYKNVFTITIMLNLKINRTQTISMVKRQFNTIFPFLKLEFFRQEPIAGIGNAKNKMIITDVKLKEIQVINKDGIISFEMNTTVSDLENNFSTEFGLYVQVFRKSGKIWLETTATDNWTLEQQNEEGKSLEQHLKIEPENPNDHDIY